MVSVDLIRPWTTAVNGQELEVKTKTIVDTVTNLLEIVRIDNKKSSNIMQLFTNTWLAQYPWPAQIIQDNEGEFILHDEFQEMMRTLGITAKLTTVKNWLRIHSKCNNRQTIAQNDGRYLHVMLYNDLPENEPETTKMIDNALLTLIHVSRCTVNHTM